MLVLSIILLALLFGACAGGAPLWSRDRGNAQNTGASIFNMSGPLSSLRLKWKIPMASSNSLSPSVTLRQDSNLYFGSVDRRLYSINYTQGSILSIAPSGNAISASAAIDLRDGLTAYVGDEGSFLYKVDSLGNVIWTSYAGGGAYYACPALSGPIDGYATIFAPLYLDDSRGALLALRTLDGVKIWQTNFTDGGTVRAMNPAISLDGRIVYQVTSVGTLWALNSTYGTVLWRVAEGQYNSLFDTSPVVGFDGTVYVAACSPLLRTGGIFAYNGTTGAQLWNFSAMGCPKSSSPAVDDRGVVYVGADDRYLYALKSGVLLWSVFSVNGDVDSSPTLSRDGLLVIGDSGGVAHCLVAATGTSLGTYLLGTSFSHTSPAIAPDGTVYLPSASLQQLFALTMQHCEDGTELVAPPWSSCVPCPPNTFNGNASIGGACIACPKGSCSRGGAKACSAADCLVPSPPGPSYFPGSPWPKEWGAGGSTSAAAANVSFPLPARTGVPLLFQQAWATTVQGAYYWSPTSAADGTIFAGADFVYAINDGAELWRFWTTLYACCSPAIGSNMLVYTGCADGNLIALNASTGALQWRFRGGGSFISSAIALGFGSVLVGDSVTQKVYALDQWTGALRWYFSAPLPFDTSPAIYENRIFIFCNDFERGIESILYALDGAQGSLLWSYTVGWRSLSPVVDNGIVYMLDSSGVLQLLSADKGTQLFQTPMGLHYNNQPTAWGGLLFLHGQESGSGNVTALDGKTGDLVWQHSFEGGAIGVTPAVVVDSNNLLYCVQDNTIWIFEAATGVLRSVYSHGTVIRQHSAGRGGSIILADDAASYVSLKPTFCDAGNYLVVTNMSFWNPASYCAPCPPGSFLSQPSSRESCDNCPPGTSSPAGSSSCIIAPTNGTATASSSGSISPSPSLKLPSPASTGSLSPSPFLATPSLFSNRSVSPSPTLALPSSAFNGSGFPSPALQSPLSSQLHSFTATPPPFATPSYTPPSTPSVTVDPVDASKNFPLTTSSSTSTTPAIAGSASAIIAVLLIALCARVCCLRASRTERRRQEDLARARIHASLERGRAANNALAALLATEDEEGKSQVGDKTLASSSSSPPPSTSSSLTASNSLRALFQDGLGEASIPGSAPAVKHAHSAFLSTTDPATPLSVPQTDRFSHAVAEALLLEMMTAPPPEEALQPMIEEGETALASTATTTTIASSRESSRVQLHEHARDRVVKVESQRAASLQSVKLQLEDPAFSKKMRVALTLSLARTFATIVLQAAATVASKPVMVSVGQDGLPPSTASASSNPAANSGGINDATFLEALLAQAEANLDAASAGEEGEGEELASVIAEEADGAVESEGEVATEGGSGSVKSPTQSSAFLHKHTAGSVVGISIELSQHVKRVRIDRSSASAIPQAARREVHSLLASATKGEIAAMLRATAKVTTRVVATEVVSRLTEQDVAMVQSAAVLGLSVDALPVMAKVSSTTALPGETVSSNPLSSPSKVKARDGRGGEASTAASLALEVLLQQQLPPERPQPLFFFPSIFCSQCFGRGPPISAGGGDPQHLSETKKPPCNPPSKLSKDSIFMIDNAARKFAGAAAGVRKDIPSPSSSPPMSSLLLDFCDARKPRVLHRPGGNGTGGDSNNAITETAAILALVKAKRLGSDAALRPEEGGGKLTPAAGQVDLLNPMHTAQAAKKKGTSIRRGSTAEKVAIRLNFLGATSDALNPPPLGKGLRDGIEEEVRVSMNPMKGRNSRKAGSTQLASLLHLEGAGEGDREKEEDSEKQDDAADPAKTKPIFTLSTVI